MLRKPWTERDEKLLARLKSEGLTYAELSEQMGRTWAGIEQHWKQMGYRPRMPESPHTRYLDPLVMEGDAVVYPDLEMPFHNADFVNRVLDLGSAWGIDKAILAGDMLHMDTLSGWQPNWTSEGDDDTTPNFSREMREAQGAVSVFDEAYDDIHCIMGNHEGRLLRQMQTPLFPSEILKQLGRDKRPKWRVLPFYQSNLLSGGQLWRITHPRFSSKFSARKLCSKFICHVAMAHSHHWAMTMDASANFFAVEMGCCVDEARLPYASQRDSAQDQHVLGALIVRDGKPYLLSPYTDWKRMANL